MTALRPYLRGLLLIAGLAALGYLVKSSGLTGIADEAWIDANIRGRGLAGQALFIAVGALVIAVGLPRQAIGFLGGYGFGLFEGTVLALIASGLGCILAFTAARLAGRATVLRLAPERIRRIDAFLRDYPFSMTLLIRLLPVGSNLLTNLAAGVSGVRAVYFVSGSVLGYIPQTVVFALLGSGIHLEPGLRITLSAILFVVCAMIGIYVFRRYRKSRALDREMAEQAALPSEQETSRP